MESSRPREKTTEDREKSRDTPRHLQLYQLLRSRIESGQYPVDGPFPTEEQLRAEQQVSRYALREALQRLESEGLIRRRRGSGSSVISRTPTNVFHHVASSHADLLSYASATRVAWKESRMIRTDGRLARLLGCDEMRPWQYLHGIRYEENGAPLGVVQVYVEAALPPLPELSAFGDSPVYRWVEQNCDVRLVSLSHDIMAKPLSNAEAEQLNDRPGTAAIQIVRRYFDSADAILLISVNTFRSHDFVYNIRSQLRRES